MCGKGNSNVICKKNGLLCKVPNKSPEENKKRRFLQSSRRWNKKHLGPFFYNITSQAVVGQIELHTTLYYTTTYSHCLRSEKKFHFDFDFFHFYLIKSVIWQPPAMHPGDWPE